MFFLYKFKLDLLKQNAQVHFIGFGGISMSAIAEILLKNGFSITGSDVHETL